MNKKFWGFQIEVELLQKIKLEIVNKDTNIGLFLNDLIRKYFEDKEELEKNF